MKTREIVLSNVPFSWLQSLPSFSPVLGTLPSSYVDWGLIIPQLNWERTEYSEQPCSGLVHTL